MRLFIVGTVIVFVLDRRKKAAPKVESEPDSSFRIPTLVSPIEAESDADAPDEQEPMNGVHPVPCLRSIAKRNPQNAGTKNPPRGRVIFGRRNASRNLYLKC